MFCPNCGHNVNEGAAFCGSCGTPMNQAQQSQHQQSTRSHHTQQQVQQDTIDEEYSYITSYLTFYLKGKFGIHNDHVDLVIPNTILGLIPLGSNERSIDVNHIASVACNFKVTILTLLFGLWLALLGFGTLPEYLTGALPGTPLGSLIEGAIGALLFLNSLKTTVTLTLTSSEVITIPLIIFEKSKAKLIRDQISRICAVRTYDTNTRVHTEYQTSQIVDALQNRA